MAIKDIEAVIDCWTASAASMLNPGATPAELQDAARILRRRLPEELVALYERCNGGDVLEGNIQLYPLHGADLSLLQASDFLRRHRWPIPLELIIFAGDGQGGSFGLWLPEDESTLPLVVEVGEIFEEGSLSVTGTSLSGFLRGRSAYYVLLLECPKAASEALDLPKRFRSKRAEDLDDADYEALMRWANPGLPRQPVSSYEARLTADDVRRLAMTSG